MKDDETLADALTVGLRLSGFTHEYVATCADAREALAQDGFAGVVLDLMLPDGSGLDILGELRAAGSRLPVLLLRALDEVRDRIAGLAAGADDYPGKPFDLEELGTRLRTILRRGEGRAAAELAWNGLVVDPSRLRARRDGAEIAFSQREFVILTALMERPGAILDKAALEERLYGWQEGVESNTVEVHIHKLRAKLGAGFIESVRGAGYRLAGP